MGYRTIIVFLILVTVQVLTIGKIEEDMGGMLMVITTLILRIINKGKRNDLSFNKNFRARNWSVLLFPAMESSQPLPALAWIRPCNQVHVRNGRRYIVE